VNLVGIATVERLAFGIRERRRVLRADANHFYRHRRGDAGGVIEHHAVNREFTTLPLVAAVPNFEMAAEAKPRSGFVDVMDYMKLR
jgi:integrase